MHHDAESLEEMRICLPGRSIGDMSRDVVGCSFFLPFFLHESRISLHYAGFVYGSNPVN